MSQVHSTIATGVLANVAAGSATNNTFYYYMNMQDPVNFRKLGVQFEWTAGGTGTVTVIFEGSLQDDGTADSSCTYQDITNQTFGVASYTDDFMALDNNEKLACFKYVRMKVVTLTTDGSTAWKAYYKKVA